MLGTTKPEGINKSDVVEIWVQCEKKGIPDCRGQGQNVEVNAEAVGSADSRQELGVAGSCQQLLGASRCHSEGNVFLMIFVFPSHDGVISRTRQHLKHFSTSF